MYRYCASSFPAVTVRVRSRRRIPNERRLLVSTVCGRARPERRQLRIVAVKVAQYNAGASVLSALFTFLSGGENNMAKKQMMTIDGNTAAAHVAYAFSDVAAIYP
ncbi:hypothetical protein KAW44_00760, partial [Candidatus Bipolaricaulota bacterium]|nr:hypothetical protein [Candidatus Bipolaricaulota bacterium]